MSPILLRPVREQLEHDRVIRLLGVRSKRRFQVAINPGSELNAPAGSAADAIFPDVVLCSLERGHRLQIVVEVETGESVNSLEALSEWSRLAKLRAAFHLYVPAGSAEAARRLCADHNIGVHEIWSYHPIGDQMHFTMVYRAPAPARPSRRLTAPSGKPATRARVRKPAPRRPARSAARSRGTTTKPPSRSRRPPARKK